MYCASRDYGNDWAERAEIYTLVQVLLHHWIFHIFSFFFFFPIILSILI